MSMYDNKYPSSLLYSQKPDSSSKYSVSSLTKDSSYQGYKPESQGYTNPAMSYATKGLGTSLLKQSTSKPQDPLGSMPPINYKRTDSYMTSNYPSITPSMPTDSILSRDLNKRSMVPPSPQSQGQRTGVSMERSYGKDYTLRNFQGVAGQVTAAAAYVNDKTMQGQRPGLPLERNYAKDYTIKDYQGAIGGQITAAAVYAQEKSVPYADRKFIGIHTGIKQPTASSNSSRKGQYGYQAEYQDDMSSPMKMSKGQTDIYARSNSRYEDPYYNANRDIGFERDGSGRSGATSTMVSTLADRSIGSISRPGEIDKLSTDPYSRKTTLQSNNYMNSSVNPTSVGMKTYENDTYGGRSILQKNEPTPIVKSSSGTWVASEPKGLVGLRNIGNTCFMNSILQSLFNAPEFSDFISSGKYSNQINHKREKGIARAFADILSKIRSHVGSPSYSAESTFILKRKIEESNAMFSGYEQHDAQEFLKALLEGIHEDLNRVHQKPAYKELKADVNRPLQTTSSEWYEYMLGRDNSIITDLFSGQLLSRTTCLDCGYQSLAFDNFWDLSVSFTRGLSMLGGCDLVRMIEHFLKEEILEDLFNCERCKQKKKFKKCFVIWRLPKILVVHIKRFHYGKYKKEKITQSVRFPVHDLDLTEFVKESKDPLKDAHYSLFGIVNHSGSLNGGHYTAECLNPFNRKWYNFNDSSVRDSHALDPRDGEAEGESPYILFYVKK